MWKPLLFQEYFTLRLELKIHFFPLRINSSFHSNWKEPLRGFSKGAQQTHSYTQFASLWWASTSLSSLKWSSIWNRSASHTSLASVCAALCLSAVPHISSLSSGERIARAACGMRLRGPVQAWSVWISSQRNLLDLGASEEAYNYIWARCNRRLLQFGWINSLVNYVHQFAGKPCIELALLFPCRETSAVTSVITSEVVFRGKMMCKTPQRDVWQAQQMVGFYSYLCFGAGGEGALSIWIIVWKA